MFVDNTSVGLSGEAKSVHVSVGLQGQQALSLWRARRTTILKVKDIKYPGLYYSMKAMRINAYPLKTLIWQMPYQQMSHIRWRQTPLYGIFLTEEL